MLYKEHQSVNKRTNLESRSTETNFLLDLSGVLDNQGDSGSMLCLLLRLEVYLPLFRLLWNLRGASRHFLSVSLVTLVLVAYAPL